MADGTEIAPYAEIGQLIGLRDRAIGRYKDLLESVRYLNNLVVPLSDQEWRRPNVTLQITGNSSYSGVTVDDYTKRLDRAAWHDVMKRSELGSLMGEKQRREWDRQLEAEPPPFTLATVVATFKDLRDHAHLLFRQGLVDAFENLPRDFRSHDGFKIGDRCVMQWAVEYNQWSKTCSWRNTGGALMDLDRTFHKLAGIEWVEKAYHVADAAMRKGLSEASTRFFKVRWFKNGNVHLWMLDAEITRRANLMLADHYGKALGRMKDKP